MHKILKILLVLVLVTFTSCSSKSGKSFNANKTNLATIEFGKQDGKKIKWLVILDDETQQILLSEKVLDVKLYNDADVKISWDKTTLYDYLNSDFVNECFTKEERESLAFINNENTDLVTLPTTDNLIDLYGTINYIIDGFYGKKDFFAPNENILAYPMERAINNDIDPFDNKVFSEYLRVDVDSRYEYANGAVPYWLLNQSDSGLPLYVTSTGYIDVTAADTGYIGIRPIIKVVKK